MSKILTLSTLLLLLGFGFVACSPQQNTDQAQQQIELMEDGQVMETEAEISMEDSDTASSQADQMPGKYVEYDEAMVATAASEGRAVLFFHAGWCPTCRSADADIKANMESIPAELSIFKVDYDSATKLRDMYNITTQHTFVQVDETGQEITKWVGGDLDQIISRTES